MNAANLMACPMVELRNVLKLDLDIVEIDPTVTYEMVGVYSFGRGLFRKESVFGGSTSYKFFYRLKAEHIVMSQLFGWEGALSPSSESFAGLFVSPQFPTFLCDTNQLEPAFLGWLMRRPSFWRDLGKRTKGMGDRRRTLNPEALLQTVVSLPSIAEQRRIVARVEELAGKVEEARGLRLIASQEVRAFVSSLHLHLAQSRIVRLGDVLMLDEQQDEVQLGKKYPQVGVKGFGGGLFVREILDATQTTYRVFNRLYEGAIVLSQVKGWEGAIAGCPKKLVGKFVSPEYRTFRCQTDQALSEYMAALVITPWFWIKLKDLTRGVGGRRERIRPEQFLKMEIPMPMLAQQKYALTAIDKLVGLKQMQAETDAELNALLPSILDKAFKGEL